MRSHQEKKPRNPFRLDRLHWSKLGSHYDKGIGQGSNLEQRSADRAIQYVFASFCALFENLSIHLVRQRDLQRESDQRVPKKWNKSEQDSLKSQYSRLQYTEQTPSKSS